MQLPAGDTLPGGGGMLYPKLAVFESSQSWTFPATALPVVDYDVIAAGASGGGKANSGGGGGGERRRGSATLVPGDDYSMVVGAPGLGVAGANGQAGGDSAIVGVVTTKGGKPPSDQTGGDAGNGTHPARPGQNPIVSDSGPGGTSAANSGDGGIGLGGVCSGGGAGTYSGSAGRGGPGAGDGSIADNAPSSATRPGCGGGGASDGTKPGGNGFRGEIRIQYWDTVP